MCLCADQLKGAETPSATSSGAQDKFTKLFEKEEDNQYSEVLLPIQLAAVALNRWSQHICEGQPVGGSWPTNTQGAVRHVQSVLTETFQSLQMVCESLLADTGMGQVSGMRMSGPSNDVSSFAAVYRLALTIIAFAPFKLRCGRGNL
jgi:hypothetical protein